MKWLFYVDKSLKLVIKNALKMLRIAYIGTF